MQKIRILDGHRVQVSLPTDLPYIPISKVGAILDVDRYKSPFQAWCDIMIPYDRMTHKETPQRLAGRLLEPRIAQFLGTQYGLKITTPEDYTHGIYPDRTRANIYNKEDQLLFGGIWDFMGEKLSDVGKPDGDVYIIEVKTTGKPDDYFIGDNSLPPFKRTFSPPLSVELQCAFYAWNITKIFCNKCAIACAVIPPDAYPVKTDSGYDTSPTESFNLTSENLFVETFDLLERFPNFKSDYLDRAARWWTDHIATGISPAWDPVRDARQLNFLKKYCN